MDPRLRRDERILSGLSARRSRLLQRLQPRLDLRPLALEERGQSEALAEVLHRLAG
jgi:hypothetical protein